MAKLLPWMNRDDPISIPFSIPEAALARIHYFVFDLLVYKNRNLTQLPLIERREIMRSVVRFDSPRIRIADHFETSAANMLQAIREQRLEGIVAKRKDSLYEA